MTTNAPEVNRDGKEGVTTGSETDAKKLLEKEKEDGKVAAFKAQKERERFLVNIGKGFQEKNESIVRLFKEQTALKLVLFAKARGIDTDLGMARKAVTKDVDLAIGLALINRDERLKAGLGHPFRGVSGSIAATDALIVTAEFTEVSTFLVDAEKGKETRVRLSLDSVFPGATTGIFPAHSLSDIDKKFDVEQAAPGEAVPSK